MPLKYQRTYGKKNAIKSKNICIPNITEFADNSLVEPTLFQERVASPDVISTDWNDTFDKLKCGSPSQTCSYKNFRETNQNNESSFLCSSPAKTEIYLAKEGIQSLTDNIKNVTQNSIISITDSESEIDSLKVTVNKSLLKEHNASTISSEVNVTSLSDIVQCRLKPKLERTFENSHENLSLQSNAKWSINECEKSLDDKCLNCTNEHSLLTDENSPWICGNDENALPMMNNKTVQIADINKDTVNSVIAVKPVIKLQTGKKWRRSLSGYIRNSKVINVITTRLQLIDSKDEDVMSINNIEPGTDRLSERNFNSSMEAVIDKHNSADNMKPIAESSPMIRKSNIQKPLQHIERRGDFGPKRSAKIIIQNSTADISRRLYFNEETEDKTIDLVVSKDNMMTYTNVGTSSSLNEEKFRFELSKKIESTSKPIIKLESGKKWRRSLSTYIRNRSYDKGLSLAEAELSLINEEPLSVNMSNIDPDFQNENFNDNIANLSIVDKDISYISISSDELEYSAKSNASHKSTAKSRSVFSNYNSRLSDIVTYDSSSASAYEVVLRRCGQTEPLPFDHCYSDIALQKCHKIGEGLFGEVFLYKDLITAECSVLKIIPIEGSLIVNGEKQKNFDEILAEIIIVMELSDLHCNSENETSGFCPLKKISCVKGKYPETLLDLWELYDEQHGSENDNPQMFGDDQLYIVLELGNAGAELESFRFTNAKQTLSVFRQITFSLAVAERALEFEHRDLHWGNVLIVRTSEKAVSYKIDGRTFTVPLHGVKATIIDFSYSRITFNGQALFSDLGTEEELFSADGDYQFDIYRLMRQKNHNNWRSYQPFSNILWLHYLVDKMIEGVKYVNTKTKVHNISIVDLQFYKESLLSYDKINAFIEDFNYFS